MCFVLNFGILSKCCTLDMMYKFCFTIEMCILPQILNKLCTQHTRCVSWLILLLWLTLPDVIVIFLWTNCMFNSMLLNICLCSSDAKGNLFLFFCFFKISTNLIFAIQKRFAIHSECQTIWILVEALAGCNCLQSINGLQNVPFVSEVLIVLGSSVPMLRMLLILTIIIW